MWLNSLVRDVQPVSRPRPSRRGPQRSFTHAKAWRKLVLEQLEDRTLLSNSAANVFATFDGVLKSPTDTKQVNIALTPQDFTLFSQSMTTQTVVLGFHVKAVSGSPLDPAAVQIRTANNTLITPDYVKTGLAHNTESLVLAQLALARYSVTISGEHGTAGAFSLEVYLAGDVDGNRKVDNTDFSLLISVLGSVAGDGRYRVEADADLDGRIDNTDIVFAMRNNGAATRINPLSLTEAISPDPAHLSDGSLITDIQNSRVVGTTTPGATVALETGTDSNFDEGTQRADALGNYSFPVTLSVGPNTLRVLSSDSFGQMRTATVSVKSQTHENFVLQYDQDLANRFKPLVQTVGLDAARNQILSTLQHDPNIRNATLCSDGTTVDFTYVNGLTSAISTAPKGTLGSPGSNTGVALQYYDFATARAITNILDRKTLIVPSLLRAEAGEFTLDAVRHLGGKGVIVLNTHGDIDKNNHVMLMTGDTLSTFLANPIPYLIDWALDRIEPDISLDGAPEFWSVYWYFKPSFISAYLNPRGAKTLPDSLVVVCACHSLENNSMADAFLGAGAATYVGYSGTVYNDFDKDISRTLFNRLAKGWSIKRAFNKWTNLDRTELPDSTHPKANAYFKYIVNDNLNDNLTLPLRLIVNIHSDFQPTGGGGPYDSDSDIVGNFYATDIQFATDTNYRWHPFDQSSFGADITGTLIAAWDGDYSFTLYSDDGSQLFIPDVKDGAIVDDGDPHPPQKETDSCYLTKGPHNFEVQFFEAYGGESGVDLTLPAGISYAVLQPQFFAGNGQMPAGDTANLTQEQLQPVVAQAIVQLAAAGFQVSGLGQAEFHLVSLPGALLGWTYQNTIWIDPSAAGYGWYTDISPGSNAAFTRVTGANEVLALPGSPAYGHVDLLTVVIHELGHVLGFASIDPAILEHDWMTATLGTGIRRYPDAAIETRAPQAVHLPPAPALQPPAASRDEWATFAGGKESLDLFFQGEGSPFSAGERAQRKDYLVPLLEQPSVLAPELAPFTIPAAFVSAPAVPALPQDKRTPNHQLLFADQELFHQVFDQDGDTVRNVSAPCP